MSVGVPGVPLFDAAGLDHVAGNVAGDHGGVVLRRDGDGDHLRGAVDGQRREAVGQRGGGIERLHRRHCCCPACKSTSRRHQRECAEAVDARGRQSRPHSRHPAGLSTSVAFRLPITIGVPGVPLATPPASITLPACRR